MPNLLADREETVDRLSEPDDLATEQKWPAIVFLVMLILTAITGVGLLCYKVEHPVAMKIFQDR